MKLYRICTEAKNVEAIKDIVSVYFDGFDIKHGEGSWKRVAEPSLTIEIMTEPVNSYKIELIATHIKMSNQQETVLVQEIECEGRFV